MPRLWSISPAKCLRSATMRLEKSFSKSLKNGFINLRHTEFDASVGRKRCFVASSGRTSSGSRQFWWALSSQRSSENTSKIPRKFTSASDSIATRVNFLPSPSVRTKSDAVSPPNVFSLGNINPLRDDGFLNDFRKSKLPVGGSSSPMNESEYSKAFAAYIDRILAAQAIGQVHPLVRWSYQLNDLLITCVFNERLCHSNLTLLFHPNYGNCYTFDHKSHVRREKTQTRHDWSVDQIVGDYNYKLYLELFLHQQEYNQYFDERAGFRLFIHRTHELPMLSETSLFLGPDRYTKLSFSQRVLSFTQRCRTDLTENMQRIFSTKQVRYTQALCLKLCEQRFLEDRCDCVLPTLFVFYQFYSNRDDRTSNETRICSIDNECIQNRISFSKKRIEIFSRLDFSSRFARKLFRMSARMRDHSVSRSVVLRDVSQRQCGRKSLGSRSNSFSSWSQRHGLSDKTWRRGVSGKSRVAREHSRGGDLGESRCHRSSHGNVRLHLGRSHFQYRRTNRSLDRRQYDQHRGNSRTYLSSSCALLSSSDEKIKSMKKTKQRGLTVAILFGFAWIIYKNTSMKEKANTHCCNSFSFSAYGRTAIFCNAPRSMAFKCCWKMANQACVQNNLRRSFK